MRHFFKLAAAAAVICGCAQPPVTRHYTEVFIESTAAVPRMAATAGSREMPQDAIHAGLMSGTMPQDAIHAGLVSGGMPQDATHAGLASGTMPQDAIHAGLSSSSPGSASSGAPQAGDMSAMPITPELERSVDRSALQWQTPPEWTEQKGSGMRLVTFTSDGNAGPTETTIISLGGQAGGLEANVGRWMRQVNISTPQADLQRFLATQERIETSSGMTGTLIDLTALQPDTPGDAPSMIAAVIDRGRSQIFVKMSGPKAAVQEQKDNLRSLVQSISE